MELMMEFFDAEKLEDKLGILQKMEVLEEIDDHVASDTADFIAAYFDEAETGRINRLQPVRLAKALDTWQRDHRPLAVGLNEANGSTVVGATLDAQHIHTALRKLILHECGIRSRADGGDQAGFTAC